MPTLQKSLIQKGIFGVTVVAAVAVVGVVGFARAATPGSGSGYGTSSQTQLAAADTFETNFVSVSDAWVPGVESDLSKLEASIKASDTSSTDGFQETFNSANAQYGTNVSNALETFRTAVENAKNSGENKDQFIDSFNHAKADYFNTLEQAKNTLADQLNRFGDAVAKDQFMNAYNTRKDAYGNQLEQIKNDFAATLG